MTLPGASLFTEMAGNSAAAAAGGIALPHYATGAVSAIAADPLCTAAVRSGQLTDVASWYSSLYNNPKQQSKPGGSRQSTLQDLPATSKAASAAQPKVDDDPSTGVQPFPTSSPGQQPPLKFKGEPEQLPSALESPSAFSGRSHSKTASVDHQQKLRTPGSSSKATRSAGIKSRQQSRFASTAEKARKRLFDGYGSPAVGTTSQAAKSQDPFLDADAGVAPRTDVHQDASIPGASLYQRSIADAGLWQPAGGRGAVAVSGPSPILTLPPPSQLDPEVLDALPLAMKRELERAYSRRGQAISPPSKQHGAAAAAAGARYRSEAAHHQHHASMFVPARAEAASAAAFDGPSTSKAVLPHAAAEADSIAQGARHAQQAAPSPEARRRGAMPPPPQAARGSHQAQVPAPAAAGSRHAALKRSRGQLDGGGLGAMTLTQIDPDVLQELPEDVRKEVLASLPSSRDVRAPSSRVSRVLASAANPFLQRGPGQPQGGRQWRDTGAVQNVGLEGGKPGRNQSRQAAVASPEARPSSSRGAQPQQLLPAKRFADQDEAEQVRAAFESCIDAIIQQFSNARAVAMAAENAAPTPGATDQDGPPPVTDTPPPVAVANAETSGTAAGEPVRSLQTVVGTGAAQFPATATGDSPVGMAGTTPADHGAGSAAVDALRQECHAKLQASLQYYGQWLCSIAGYNLEEVARALRLLNRLAAAHAASEGLAAEVAKCIQFVTKDVRAKYGFHLKI